MKIIKNIKIAADVINAYATDIKVSIYSNNDCVFPQIGKVSEEFHKNNALLLVASPEIKNGVNFFGIKFKDKQLNKSVLLPCYRKICTRDLKNLLDLALEKI